MQWLVVGNAWAKDWQIMLLPEKKEESTQQELAQIEQGIRVILSRGMDKIIDRTKVFDNCSLDYCGAPSLNAALNLIQKKAPEVQLALVYELNIERSALINYRLVDPLSKQIRFANSIQFAPNELNMLEAGSNLAKAVQLSLRRAQATQAYTLALNKFDRDELDGLTTFLLTNSVESEINLIRSRHYFTLLNRFFPLISSEYRLSTALSASQVKQSVERFFDEQGTQVIIDFDVQTSSMSINRKGHAHSPSFVFSLLVILLILLFILILLHRQYLQYNLQDYADKRDADTWLRYYKKLSIVHLGLKKAWLNQASHWERLKRESSDLADQGKVYFDAGDINTAKLFISKALYANSSNAKALELLNKVELLAQNQQNISDDEQWIRNKIAKSMNNYRQQFYLKALKQAYQAHARAMSNKALKRQAKAINTLIKKINRASYSNISTVQIHCTSNATKILICHKQVVQLGREPNKVDEDYVSPQDARFYINHKMVSRVGRHCAISHSGKGFTVIDHQSKNGTFINNIAIRHNQAQYLKDSDIIQLGSADPFIAANLHTNISQNHQLMTLNFIKIKGHDQGNANIDEIWPEHGVANNSSLVCTQSKCCIAWNTFERALEVYDLESFLHRDTSGKSNVKGMCILSLGEKASIAPFISTANIQSEQVLKVNDESVIGEVALTLPIIVKYGELSFTVDEHLLGLTGFIDKTLIAQADRR